jgi:hypothetical protein
MVSVVIHYLYKAYKMNVLWDLPLLLHISFPRSVVPKFFRPTTPLNILIPTAPYPTFIRITVRTTH